MKTNSLLLHDQKHYILNVAFKILHNKNIEDITCHFPFKKHDVDKIIKEEINSFTNKYKLCK